MSRGCLITLEGADGAGKSTQTKRLVDRLQASGKDAVATREVGGCPQAEKIRDVWLNQGDNYWDPWSELLLLMAARREHWARTIEPALARGCWVVCDRFVDSTRVYQGMVGGIGLPAVDSLWRMVVPHCEPTLTLVLDIPVAHARARIAERGDSDRFQERGVKYAEKLQKAWYELTSKYPERMFIIDASGSLDDVEALIWGNVTRRMPQHFC